MAPVGIETQVNSFTTSDQKESAIAIDAAGDYVVVWQSTGQDGSGFGVFAQRYNAAGLAQGGEFQVNTFTTSDQGSPAIGMDDLGNFVIAWQSFSQDGSSNSIFAKRYNAAGAVQGAEFQVNTFTTSSQKSPSVAMNSTGSFVIAWQSSGQDGDSYGIYAQRYNAAGTSQGAEFQVNTFTTNSQASPSVSMDTAGDFVVTWQSFGQDGNSNGIFAQRYNSTGATVGSEFMVNTFTTGNQQSPSVGMTTNGDFLIAWQSANQDGNSDGIFAQYFSVSGNANGSEYRVNTFTTGAQAAPVVAPNDFGEFVVAWHSLGQDGSSDGIYAQHIELGGFLRGTGFHINSFTTGSQNTASVAMNVAGDLVAAWSSLLQDGSASGVYSQRFHTTIGPVVTSVQAGDVPTVVKNGDVLTAVISSLTVSFTDDLRVDPLNASSVTNRSNWRLVRYGADVSNLISGITFGLNPAQDRFDAVVSLSQPLDDGVYQLVARQLIHDAPQNRGLDGEGDRVTGGDFRRNFAVGITPQPAGSETRINTFTTGAQADAAIAMDAAGDYVIVWHSAGQDGSGEGVYAQLFSAAGTAQGPEFRVNTFTTGDQTKPVVAMDATGDFVVAWQSDAQDGNLLGVFAQRFNAKGAVQGAEFQVNTFTTNAQFAPSIAADAAGNFVVAWVSTGQDLDSKGVYAKRFNAAGIPLSGDIRVNTFTTDAQNVPAIGMNADGDFVVAWSSYNQDGNSYGVYAQRFDAAGASHGLEFRVNTVTTSPQAVPAVAMDSAGDFVIAWQSRAQDGSGYGIFAQRFNAAGTAQDGEFRVNSNTISDQTQPAVAMDSAGDFVITWQSNYQDGDGFGIIGRRYNSLGVTQGDEFQVNTFTTGFQRLPAIAMVSSGDLVVAWSSLSQDGSNYGVYAQRYQGEVAPFLPHIEDTPLAATASLFTPVTTALLVFDQDSDNLTGATVQIADGYRKGEDVLKFTNTAKITGVFDTTSGTLKLTGIDSVSNYRSALRSVTYHNSSAIPNTAVTRTIDIQVTDGFVTSNVLSRDLTVLASSTPPVVSGVSGTGTYFENAAPLLLAPGLTISDVDSVNLASATVTITGWQAEDRLNFNNIFALGHTFIQDLPAHTATFIIAGVNSIDHYQTLLRSVVYSNVSDNPITTARIASIVVNDGLSNSNSVVRNTVVSPVNDPPLLSAIETGPLTYKANDPAFPPQAISATLLVSEPDSNNLTKATVQITVGYQNDANGHDLLSFTNQLGITGSFNAATGTLTLTGTSGVGNYRTALRTVTFSSSGSSVSSATRTLSIIGTDDFGVPANSAPITRNVNVATTNLPPGLAGIPVAALAYVRGAAAAIVAPAAIVLDLDSINLAGATFQITANYQNGQDVLNFTPGFGVTGSFNSATGTLTLSGITSIANYQTLIRSVTYKTNTAGASTLTRTISSIINDGLDLSNAVSRNVTLT